MKQEAPMTAKEAEGKLSTKPAAAPQKFKDLLL